MKQYFMSEMCLYIKENNKFHIIYPPNGNNADNVPEEDIVGVELTQISEEEYYTRMLMGE